MTINEAKREEDDADNGAMVNNFHVFNVVIFMPHYLDFNCDFK